MLGFIQCRPKLRGCTLGLEPQTFALQVQNGDACGPQAENCENECSRRNSQPMPPRELAYAIGGRRRPRFHRLIAQEAPDVLRKGGNRRAPSSAILFERLEGDPVEVTPELAREPRCVGLPGLGRGS